MNNHEINEAYDKLLKGADDIGKEIEKKELTDDEIDQISKSMEDLKNSDEMLKMISELPSNNGILDNTVLNKETEEMKDELMTVKIDPVTGEKKVISPAPEKTYDLNTTFEELWQDAISDPSVNIDDISLKDESIASKASEDFGIKDIGEMTEFIKLIKEYKEGKTSNVYMRLPEKIRHQIDLQAMSLRSDIPSSQIRSAKNGAAKELIEEFIKEVSFDQTFINIETELNNIMHESCPAIKSFYIEGVQNKIDSLEKIKEKIDESDADQKEERKAKIQAIIDAIKDAHSLDGFASRIGSIRIRKIDYEKPEKIYRDFDSKYTNSIYTIHSVKLLFPILVRVLKEEDPIYLLQFILAFCKDTMNMKPSVMEEHIYMYFFISNIIYLGYQGEEVSEYEKETIEAIKKCLEKIKK